MERLHVEASVAQAKDLPSCVIGLPVASHDLLSMLIRSMTATVVGSVQIAIYHIGGTAAGGMLTEPLRRAAQMAVASNEDDQ